MVVTSDNSYKNTVASTLVMLSHLLTVWEDTCHVMKCTIEIPTWQDYYWRSLNNNK